MKCAFLHSITKKLRGFLSYKVISQNLPALPKKLQEIKKNASKKFEIRREKKVAKNLDLSPKVSPIKSANPAQNLLPNKKKPTAQ